LQQSFEGLCGKEHRWTLLEIDPGADRSIKGSILAF
jgi:hypothetical protein